MSCVIGLRKEAYLGENLLGLCEQVARAMVSLILNTRRTVLNCFKRR